MDIRIPIHRRHLPFSARWLVEQVEGGANLLEHPKPTGEVELRLRLLGSPVLPDELVATWSYQDGLDVPFSKDMRYPWTPAASRMLRDVARQWGDWMAEDVATEEEVAFELRAV